MKWLESRKMVPQQKYEDSIPPQNYLNTQWFWVKMFRLQNSQTSNTGGVWSSAQGMHIEVAASSAACSNIASRDSKRLS